MELFCYQQKKWNNVALPSRSSSWERFNLNIEQILLLMVILICHWAPSSSWNKKLKYCLNNTIGKCNEMRGSWISSLNFLCGPPYCSPLYSAVINRIRTASVCTLSGKLNKWECLRNCDSGWLIQIGRSVLIWTLLECWWPWMTLKTLRHSNVFRCCIL